MITIKINERERDFLKSVVAYFQDRDGLQPYVITEKKYKFTDEEMKKLKELLK